MSIERTILADLKLDTALHIGQGKGSHPTDSPLRRAGDGRFFIPGRAIGGSLRAVATRLAPRLGLPPCKALQDNEGKKNNQTKPKPCLCPVCQLFGDLYPDEKTAENDGGEPSRLWISDARSSVARPQTHVRDGVGINRRRRAAARNVKFDYEVVPRGATFALRLRLVDDDSKEAAARAQLLAAALAEWQAGRGQLGGNSSRGLGRFHLEELRCVRTSLETADDLIAYLQSDTPWETGMPDQEWLQQALAAAKSSLAQAADKSINVPAAGGFVQAAFEIVLETPFIINDPLVALLSGFDHAPLVELALNANDQAGLPLLAGSSLRGSLRSRAEKIARTLAAAHWTSRDDFLEHCPACDPLAAGDHLPLGNCDRRLQLRDDQEVPEDALCLACRLFGSPRRGSRLRVADGVWQGSALNDNSVKVQDFLAIDRFTGGGQDQAKFDAAPLIGARFQVGLTLETPQAWELGWLALLLRDLAEGELTVGFGEAKGYARARADEFIWTVGYLNQADFPGDATLLEETQASGLYQLVEMTAAPGDWLPVGWREQAQQWVDDFVKEATTFQTGKHWQPFQEDTFFDREGRLSALYGLPRVEVTS